MFTTLMRKLMAVFIIAVFSVGLYGCGGSGGSHRSTPSMVDETTAMTIDLVGMLSDVADGYKNAMPGDGEESMFTVDPDGGTKTVGDITYTCSGSVACMVEIVVDADDDTIITVTSTGGMVTAAQSMAAMERHAAETMVMTIDLATMLPDAKDGYNNAVPDTDAEKMFTIMPGASQTVGDITYSCSGNVPCMVEIAVAADDTVTVTSTGGMVMAAQSDEAKANYQAYLDNKILEEKAAALAAEAKALVKALGIADALRNQTKGNGTPQNTLADGDTPANETTVEREGLNTEIVLATKGTLAKKYATTATTPPQINGWYGETQARDSATSVGSKEEVVIYTNIGEASNEILSKYYVAPRPDEGVGAYMAAMDALDGYLPLDVAVRSGLTKETIADLFSAREFMVRSGSAQSLEVTYGGDTAGSSTKTFPGSYRNIPGMYECAAVSCTATFDNDGKLTTLTAGAPVGGATAQWKFIPDEPPVGFNEHVIVGANPDTDFLYFGHWLNTPGRTGSYQFSTFFGGKDVFDASTVDGLTETATYKGGAAGRYVMRQRAFDQNGIEVTTSATHGQFIADAELTANFNDDVEKISGTVTNFKDGADNLGFRLTLEPTDIEENENIFDGNVRATLGLASSDGGKWNGQFFGDPVPPTGETFTGTDAHPTGVAGEFEAQFPGAEVAGAFGATRR